MKARPDRPKAEERVVAFLDILGFSEEIRARGNDPEWYEDIVSALRDGPGIAQPPSTRMEKELEALRLHPVEVEVSAFSDSLFISAPRVSGAVRRVAIRAADVALHFLRQARFVRGGIAAGLAYHDDSVVLGVGVLEAHRLESQLANYPRILLSEELGSALGGRFEEPSPLLTVRKDADGLYFLDIFSMLAEQLDEDLKGPFFARLRREVEQRIGSSAEPKHRVRWEWCFAQLQRVAEAARLGLFSSLDGPRA